MKQNQLTLATKSQYTAPQSEEIKVRIENNIMSPGGSIPGLEDDDTEITF